MSYGPNNPSGQQPGGYGQQPGPQSGNPGNPGTGQPYGQQPGQPGGYGQPGNPGGYDQPGQPGNPGGYPQQPGASRGYGPQQPGPQSGNPGSGQPYGPQPGNPGGYAQQPAGRPGNPGGYAQQPGAPGGYGQPYGQQPGYPPRPGFAQNAPNAGLPPKKSQTNITVLLVTGIVGVLVIGLVAWALFGRGSSQPTPMPTAPTTSSQPTNPATSTPPTTAPTTTEPTTTTPPADGTRVDLGYGIVVTLAPGWRMSTRSDSNMAIVTNGRAYLTVQALETSAGTDVMTIMNPYLEEMSAKYQNVTVEGPKSVDVGSNATGAVAMISGTRTGSNGSYQAVQPVTLCTRTSDGLTVLSSMLALQQDWEATTADYLEMTNNALAALLD